MFPNQYIRMISEGSCETEDWTNDAKNCNRNKLHFKKYSSRKQLLTICNNFRI